MKDTNNPNFEILVNHIKTGKKPISLCKQLRISNQLLTYYLRTLRLKGIIRKVGKGTWEIAKELPKDYTKKDKIIRGHAYIWEIRFSKEIKGWDKRLEILKNLNIPYILVGKDKNTPRIVLKGKKIWLTNKGLIIYEPKSFFDSTPLESRKLAVYELQETINSLKSKLHIDFKWEFRIVREHIAKINDLLSIQCNKEGLRLQVIDKGELWMEIDNSFNQDETEFYKTKSFSPLTQGTGYQNYFNSHKSTNWKVTPEFVLEGFNKMFAINHKLEQQISSHLALINEYRKENIAWRKSESKKIKDNIKNGVQRTLWDF